MPLRMDREYHWLHIPTGKQGTRTRFFTQLELLEHLNRWNRSAPGTWAYWSYQANY